MKKMKINLKEALERDEKLPKMETCLKLSESAYVCNEGTNVLAISSGSKLAFWTFFYTIAAESCDRELCKLDILCFFKLFPYIFDNFR